MKFYHLHHALISMSLLELENYNSHIEHYLCEQINQFNERFDAETKELSENEKDIYGEHLSDEYYTISKMYPSTFRSSLLINIFSFVEKKLNELCAYLENKYTSNIKLNDLKDSGVIRARVYLKKVIGIDFPDDLQQWKRISGVYRELRNKFAHNGGLVNELDFDSFKKKLNNLPVNLDEEFGQLELEKDFCLVFIRDVIIFFDELFKVSEQFFKSTLRKNKD